MKRILSAVLAALMLLCLAGCGETKVEKEKKDAAALYQGFIASLSQDYINDVESAPLYTYTYKNIDGEGNSELLLLNGNIIELYTYVNEEVTPLGTYNFGEGKFRLIDTGDEKYSGFIFNIDDGVTSSCNYMTLVDGRMYTQQLFKITFVGDKEHEKTENISDDKELIKLAKAALKGDGDIQFYDIA